MAMYQAESKHQPPIDPEFDWIWKAWHRLSDDRPRWGGGMGPSVPGRIPWMTMRLWAEHYRLSAAEMTLLDTGFMALDTAYIEIWIDAQKKEEP
jgi:hypothetical protein